MSWSEAETASSVPRRFAEQVRRGPDRPAIAGASRQLTYAQLDALADRCRAALLHHVGEPRAGDRVALLLGHDETVIAAALAAFGCAMTVVTLNRSDPPARLRQIGARAEPRVLITDEWHLELARAAGFRPADTLVDPWQAAVGSEPRPAGANPDDLAVLICTSGSTGEPKLVMHSHRNLLHNVMRYANGLAISEDDRVAWLASASGGQGLATALTTLLNGAVLCPFALVDRGVTGLAAWLRDQRISVFDTIPSVLRNFARTLHGERIAGVRIVRIASEGALRGDFEAFERHFGAGAGLASVLASSEAGIVAQAIYHAGDDPPAGALPVGLPVAGVRVLVLDDGGRETPAGETGEIAVQGSHLSQGYWRDPALTAERFAVVEGERRLRTGDLARRTAGGILTVVGRADMQVKVRGNRLQLEEVEAALAAQPQVGGAAVLAAATASGDTRLTAYVLAADGSPPEAARLRRGLRTVLPAHAIPSAFVFVESFPLTAHGKIDRAGLAALPPAAPAAGGRGLVASETEELVAGVWCEAFERDEIGPDEAFLELGGDSLLAAQVAARVHDLFGIDLGLDAFASDPTVATLAAVVDERRTTSVRAGVAALRRVTRSGPLSSAQARMWSAGGGSDPRWHVVVPFRVHGQLDADVLRASVQRLVARHEILRTTFVECDDRPLAVVRPSMAVELTVEDLRGAVDPLARAEEILTGELARPFDLERGPLLRLRLLRVGDAEQRLLRASHHIVHDALSWRIFLDELGLVYDALLDGRPSPLADAPELQYLDYAVWERASVRPGSPHREAEVDWWQRTLSPPPPPLRLPFARPERDPAAARDGGAIGWGLPPASSDALDRIGAAAGGTYFMTRLAAFASLLALDCGVDDLVIGTPVSTRSRTELQRMFGPFLNFGVLRLRIAGDAGFRDCMAEVRRVVLDVGAHVSVPWEQLSAQLRERGVAIPMVWARFVAWPVIAPMTLGGVTVEALPRRCTELWGFRLGVNRPHEADRCWAEFDPCLHDPVAVRRFLTRLTAFVAAICAAPDRPLGELHAALPPDR